MRELQTDDIEGRFSAIHSKVDTETQAKFLALALHMADVLIEKNRAYGNSALEPVRIFSKADKLEQIRIRIDDKLSRIAKGQDDQEDTVTDLIGYLFLLKIGQGS